MTTKTARSGDVVSKIGGRVDALRRQPGRFSAVVALGVGLAATGAAYAAGSGLAVPAIGLLTLASAVGAGAAALAWFGTS